MTSLALEDDTMNKNDSTKTPREQDAVFTTIVGGRPPGSGTSLEGIPRGIDVLLKKASVDSAFRSRLLEQRGDVAKEIDLELKPEEAMMLQAIPRQQLEAIIDRTRVKPENRRVFLGKVAALMLATLGVHALSGCADKEETATPEDSEEVQKRDKVVDKQKQMGNF
jgi:hypothetical protein